MANWFETSTGTDLVNKEIAKCTALIPAGYYANSLQVGFPGDDYLKDLVVSNRYLVDTELPAGDCQEEGSTRRMTVCSTSEALPFPEKSMDLIALPHTLDFCRNPHEVLRQVSQILVPEGCVAITGFNIASFYGAIQVFRKRSGEVPWSGHYYSVRRVQDWLSLLGFNLVGAGMMSYTPPLHSEKWRSRLAFTEKAGDRWWPGFGGVYVIVGRKKEMATTMLVEPRRGWRTLIPGIAQPAAQRAARMGIRLVPKIQETSSSGDL